MWVFPFLGRTVFRKWILQVSPTPITKHNFIVKDVNDLAKVIRRAFKIAQTGRPGPVLVDIPKDVTAAKAEFSFQQAVPVKRSTEHITEEDLQTAADLIRESKKPYIFVGGGAQ